MHALEPPGRVKEQVQAYVDGSRPLPPVCVALGIRMVAAADGFAEASYTADGRHDNAMGSLHGGVLCDLADVAMGMAMATTVSGGETFTTLELKANFVRRVRSGALRARARVVERGRTVALLACDVVDDEGRLVAHATSTALVAPLTP